MNFLQLSFPSPKPDLLEHLPNLLRCCYARDFDIADKAFFAGRVVATTKNQVTNWKYWTYVTPLGLDPYLQDTLFTWWVRALTVFAAQAGQEAFGAGHKIQSRTVSGYITSIGQTIALASGINPVKMLGSNKLLHACNKRSTVGATRTHRHQKNYPLNQTFLNF
jgi:hypothetical protein